MAVAQNQTITKTDVVNLFNTNVKNVIGSSLYHSGNHLTYSNPSGVEAIPTDQYGSGTLSSFSISDTVITSTTLYNALVELVKNYTRIRNVNSNSYLFNESNTTGDYPAYSSSDNLVQTVSGKTAFAVTVPSVSGTTRPYYVKNPNDTTMTKDISPANPGITTNAMIYASHMTQFINNLKTSWDTIYNNNVITIEYHYCHSNWGNWASRARR